jgi:hypothetical protein
MRRQNKSDTGVLRLLAKTILKETEEVVNIGKGVFWVDNRSDSLLQKRVK